MNDNGATYSDLFGDLRHTLDALEHQRNLDGSLRCAAQVGDAYMQEDIEEAREFLSRVQAVLFLAVEQTPEVQAFSKG